MEVFEIDTANIRASIKRLETLKEKCSKLKKKAIKSGKKDSGETHTQLDQEYKVMQDSWQQLITLIEKTANYMQVLCDSNDESDTMCANKLKVNLYDSAGDRDFDHYCKDNSSDIQYLHARGMTDEQIRAHYDAGGKENIDKWINELKFTPRVSAPEQGNPYYGNLASQPNCVTYARGRANEILAEKYPNSEERPPMVFSGDAKDWWNYRDSYGGYSTNVNEPKKGAIMVWGDENYSGPGHVAVVEDVIYNSDGTVKSVIYSESSWGGVWYTARSGGKQLTYNTGTYNYYENSTNSWGCVSQTPEQITHVTQDLNGERKEMGFRGYIYLD